MTRNFTMPVTFPTEYVTDSGPATVISALPEGDGYIGLVKLEDGKEYPSVWNNAGENDEVAQCLFDLHDIKRKRVLHREFGVLGRHTIECNTDGSEATVAFEKAGSYD